MLRINCPWCGERDQIEFDFGGEARIARPPEPSSFDDGEWAEYLFYRNNVRGEQRERWVHRWGCRQWFYVVRDTLTHDIHQVSKIDDTPAPRSTAKSPSAPAEGQGEKGTE